MSREAAIARKLLLRYPPPRWALLRHVQSAPGARVRDVREMDVVAVALEPWLGAEVEIIEIKCSAHDLGRQTEQKSAPFVSWASKCWIAVPSPWPTVVPSKALIRRPFGVLSVGTGKPQAVMPAEALEPAEKLPPFAIALLAAAVRGRSADAASEAPLVDVIRPYAGRGHVICEGHHAVMSLAKVPPPKVACAGCRDGRPSDPEAIEAAIRDADADQLERYAALIAAQRGRAA